MFNKIARFVPMQPSDPVGGGSVQLSGKEAIVPTLDMTALRSELNQANDLTPVIETFSRWLERFIQVEMVAYWNPRLHKSYMVCPQRDGDKSELLQAALNIIDSPLPPMRHWRQQNWIFHLWSGLPLDKWDRLLIVEHGGGLTVDEANYLMWESLQLLHQPLQRALRKEF